MDLNPVYELQERLRATAIAGANLLQEDFRLKRSAEAIKPFAAASPVFAKLCKQMELLLSPGCNHPAGVLLDTIALADAIICTLATVEVKAETKEFLPDVDLYPKAEYTRDIQPFTNAPYSKVKGLVEALTTPGSGNFAFVRDMLSSSPDVFKDYRVMPALIKSLGASYAELSELTKEYLVKSGPGIIPLLKKDFDPRGKKEMVHRANIIGEIAGADENDFYIEMLETATGDVRTALINNLSYEPSNFDLLLNMVKSEKGKNKQFILNLISQPEDKRVYDLFKQLIKKSPASVCEALAPVTTILASNVIAETCMEQLPGVIQAIENNDAAKIEKILPPFCKIVATLVGKHGDGICECYRQLLSNSKILGKCINMPEYTPSIDVLDYLFEIGDISWIYIEEKRFDQYKMKYHPPEKTNKKVTWELIIGNHIAQSLVVFPDKQLREMASELYEKNKNINFLAAAAFVRILEDNNCTSWFDEQIVNNKSALTEIQRALSYIKWDKETKGYITHMNFYLLPYEDKRKYVMCKIEIPQAAEIKNWIMEHGRGSIDAALNSQNDTKPSKSLNSQEYKRMERMDAILNRWVDTDNSAECEKYGSYFYNKALAMPNNVDYVRYLLNCRWKKCKGLGTGYVQNKKSLQLWQLTSYLFHLPGTLEEMQEEIKSVAEIVKSGKVKIAGYNQRTGNIDDWFDSSNYVTLTLDGYMDSEVG